MVVRATVGGILVATLIARALSGNSCYRNSTVQKTLSDVEVVLAKKAELEGGGADQDDMLHYAILDHIVHDEHLIRI